MDGIKVAFIMFLIISACRHSSKTINDKVNDIQIQVIKYLPYCGGAKPADEQLKGSSIPLTNTSFIIKTGHENHDSIPVLVTFTTDVMGKAKLRLSPGSYQVLFTEKAQTFSAFYQELGQGSVHLKPKPESCFRNWWRRPEAILKIQDSILSYQIFLEAKCETGFNPCLTYTGPKRP